MNHLIMLLERLREAEKQYKEANSYLDGGSLEFILAKEKLKSARFDWLTECECYILENVLGRGASE